MTHTRRHLSALAVTLSIAAAVVPAASARPIDAVPDRPDASPPPVRVVPEAGFDWRDAEIGAAAGFVAALFGVGGTLAIRNRRRTSHAA